MVNIWKKAKLFYHLEMRGGNIPCTSNKPATTAALALISLAAPALHDSFLLVFSVVVHRFLRPLLALSATDRWVAVAARWFGWRLVAVAAH